MLRPPSLLIHVPLALPHSPFPPLSWPFPPSFFMNEKQKEKKLPTTYSPQLELTTGGNSWQAERIEPARHDRRRSRECSSVFEHTAIESKSPGYCFFFSFHERYGYGGVGHGDNEHKMYINIFLRLIIKNICDLIRI